MTAVVCQLLNGKIEAGKADMHALVCGALTANVGMFHLMDELAEQNGPLTDEQRVKVNAHPARSCELLKISGIDESLILDVVLKHHEKLVGSGYPNGISELTPISSVLSLGDIYSAMLLPRKYRTGIYGKRAIQRVFSQRGEKIDSKLVSLFIKEVGIYPPGMLVKLSNKETAMVVRRGLSRADRPIVMALFEATGDQLPAPIKRDTTVVDYMITETLCPLDELPFDFATIWGTDNQVDSDS